MPYWRFGVLLQRLVDRLDEFTHAALAYGNPVVQVSDVLKKFYSIWRPVLYASERSFIDQTGCAGDNSGSKTARSCETLESSGCRRVGDVTRTSSLEFECASLHRS